MAKGKSGGRSGRTRDDLSSLTVHTLRSYPAQTFPLRQVEDLRTFDFEPDTRPARLFTGSTASVGAVPGAPSKKTGRDDRVRYQLAFEAPAKTLVCVRRARRREVLFAIKKAGRGGQRRPRRNAWSDYKC